MMNVKFTWEQAPFRDRLIRDGLRLLLAIAVIGIACWLAPSPTLVGTHQQLYLPPCTFHLVTGKPCPSCGATTSFALLVRGDVGTAFRANHLAPFLFIGIVFMGIASLAGLIAGRQFRVEMSERTRAWLLAAGFIVFLVYGAGRILV